MRDQNDPKLDKFPIFCSRVIKTNSAAPALAEKISGDKKSFDSSFLGLKIC